MGVQQFFQRHEYAWRAKTALQRVQLMKCLLKRVGLLRIVRQAFDGRDVTPVGLDRKRQAAARSYAIDEDRACATCSMFTPEMGAGQFQFSPQKITQVHAGLSLTFVRLAVDCQMDGVRCDTFVLIHEPYLDAR